MNTQKRAARAKRKAKAQRLSRWQGVPTPTSQWATKDVKPRKPSGHTPWGNPPDREVDDDGPAYLHDIHRRTAMAADAFDAGLAAS